MAIIVESRDTGVPKTTEPLYPAIRFADLHDDLRALELGKTLVVQSDTVRELRQVEGEVTYWFQGTLKENDKRLGAAVHLTLDWNWRIQTTLVKADTGYWELHLTKIEVPDHWRYSGKEMQSVLAQR